MADKLSFEQFRVGDEPTEVPETADTWYEVSVENGVVTVGYVHYDDPDGRGVQ